MFLGVCRSETTSVLLEISQKSVNREDVQASCLGFESHSSFQTRRERGEIRVKF